jgi:hypothetical protein
MTIGSVNLSSEIAAALESGDVATMQQAVRASVKDQLAANASQSLIAAKWKLADLSTLTGVRDKLTKLAVPTNLTSDGRCIVSSALNTEITSLGLPLKTTTCCQMTISGALKHLATAEEMAAAEAAPRISGPDATTGVETRAATNSWGVTTTYTLYRNDTTITASKADVQSAIGNIGTELTARVRDAGRAMLQVNAFREVVQDQGVQTTDANRRKSTNEDRQRNEAMQATIVATHKKQKD